MELWSLLICAKFWGIKDLQVLGDSRVIINWAMGEAQVKSLELHHWLENTKSLMKDFSFLSFNHVYRELNLEADTLSKIDLGKMDGRLYFSHFSAGSCYRSSHLVLFN